MPIVIFLLTGGVATVVLQMIRYGQSFYATGENPIAARLSGVPIEKMIATAFVVCGALVCEAIVLRVASVGQAMETAGNNFYCRLTRPSIWAPRYSTWRRFLRHLPAV